MVHIVLFCHCVEKWLGKLSCLLVEHFQIPNFDAQTWKLKHWMPLSNTEIDSNLVRNEKSQNQIILFS